MHYMQKEANMAQLKKKVFIDGSEGTTGLRIRERLSERTDVEIIKINDESKRKDKDTRKEYINNADIVFLCLPDDAARESVSLCENDNTVIIDASTAHRTLPEWAYGFAELSPEFRKKISSSKRIAVPGCHASGFAAIVYPLVKNGIISPDTNISCFSLTGYSGGGKKMINSYENEKTNELFSPGIYALEQTHKHLKEMKAICGLDKEPIFSPIVDDYYAGMLVTVPLFASDMKKALSKTELHEMYASHYVNENIVKVRSLDNGQKLLYANEKTSFDNMIISVTGNDDRMCIHATFDNLGKGASGAAIQCMNIALGLDEGTGLNV